MAKKVIRFLLIILVGCVLGFLLDSQHVNPIGEEAVLALDSTDMVVVKEESDLYFFDGPGTEKALIFYPGAKVDERAYAPICKELAESGIDVFLVRMPLHYAFFNMKADEKITGAYVYEDYAIAGHSLGGAMAVRRCLLNNELKHLFLLGAYVDKALPEDLDVCVLVGSEDGVINRIKLDEEEQYLPIDAEVITIEGGNHAGFGDYGHQAKDHEAKITKQEQWDITVSAILRHLS